MAQANYRSGYDGFGRWRTGIFSGTPPTRWPVASQGPLASIHLGPGRITLLGGAPGAGKTALVMQCVIDALRLTPALRTLVCNVEMPSWMLWERQLARLSGVGLEVIQDRQFNADQTERLERAANTLERLSRRTAFVRPPFDLDNIAASAEEFGADLLVLDYIQRISPSGHYADKRLAVNATMEHLRQFADQGLGLIVLAAVGRTKDRYGRASYSGDGLNLASFRESSELEYGADDAYILVPKGDLEDCPVEVTLQHLKARSHQARHLALEFNGSLQRFDEPLPKPNHDTPGESL